MDKSKKKFDTIVSLTKSAMSTFNGLPGTAEYYDNIKKKEDLIFSLIANGFVDLSK
jgi:hypothetical protein